MLVAELRSLALSISRTKIDVSDSEFYLFARSNNESPFILTVRCSALNSNDRISFNYQFAAESTAKRHPELFPRDEGGPQEGCG